MPDFVTVRLPKALAAKIPGKREPFVREAVEAALAGSGASAQSRVVAPPSAAPPRASGAEPAREGYGIAGNPGPPPERSNLLCKAHGALVVRAGGRCPAPGCPG